MTGVVIGALTVVVLLLTILVLGLLRSHAEIVRALHDAGIDLSPDGGATRTPPSPGRANAVPARSASTATDSLAGTDVAGDPVVLALAGRGRTLVAFLTSSCLTCREFWTAFGSGTIDLPEGVRLVIVTKDAAEEQPEAISRLAPRDVPVVLSSAAWVALGVPVAPYFVLFGNDANVIGEGAAATWPSVENLLRQALADDAHRAGLLAEPSVEDDDAQLRAAGIDPEHESLRPAPGSLPR